ncbi:MAG: hypothetical protein DRP00_00440 [Candidatus Aenigmatarchaeota archaeon]|nr:MAG: hypothetical protein DRP00_00440 [Candidatus Aenigmarchaeota archaeon]
MREDNLKKKFNLVLLALKASGVLAKAMKNPEETLRELIREAKTEEGREKLQNMKQQLIKRYNCEDILLDLEEENRANIVIANPKNKEIIKSDVQEILTFVSWIPGADIKAIIRDIMMIVEKNKVVISIPCKERVKEVIRSESSLEEKEEG